MYDFSDWYCYSTCGISSMYVQGRTPFARRRNKPTVTTRFGSKKFSPTILNLQQILSTGERCSPLQWFGIGSTAAKSLRTVQGAQLWSALLTPHSSFLIPHSSLLISHSSLLILHSSFLTPHSSFLTPHSSFLTPHSSFLTPHSSLLTPHLNSLLHSPTL